MLNEEYIRDVNSFVKLLNKCVGNAVAAKTHNVCDKSLNGVI